jgi:hypothetical protein
MLKQKKDRSGFTKDSPLYSFVFFVVKSFVLPITCSVFR